MGKLKIADKFCMIIDIKILLAYDYIKVKYFSGIYKCQIVGLKVKCYHFRLMYLFYAGTFKVPRCFCWPHNDRLV